MDHYFVTQFVYDAMDVVNLVYFRFRCKNRVGWSPWGLNTQISTRQRQRPEMPLLSIRTESGEILFGDVVELPRSKVSFTECV